MNHRRLPAGAVLAALLLGLALAAGARPVSAGITAVSVYACPDSISVSLTYTDPKDVPSALVYVVNGVSGGLNHLDTTWDGKSYTASYFANARNGLPAGVEAKIIANNSSKIGGATVARACPVLGRIAGMSYLDRNANGRRDPGEPPFYQGMYKITGGGDWFVCGYVGGDATFGVPVLPSLYYVLPVAPRGYRTTTPKVIVPMRRWGDAMLGNDIGFIADPKAAPEWCGQYAPSRP